MIGSLGFGWRQAPAHGQRTSLSVATHRALRLVVADRSQKVMTATLSARHMEATKASPDLHSPAAKCRTRLFIREWCGMTTSTPKAWRNSGNTRSLSVAEQRSQGPTARTGKM